LKKWVNRKTRSYSTAIKHEQEFYAILSASRPSRPLPPSDGYTDDEELDEDELNCINAMFDDEIIIDDAFIETFNAEKQQLYFGVTKILSSFFPFPSFPFLTHPIHYFV
jgi:hypothetical protein